MAKRKQPVDLDRKQTLKDVYRQNQYKLDDRFVLRDGKTHKCAIICPGGGYGMVCSFIEGTPIARRLNAMGISAFIVYYRVRKKHFIQIHRMIWREPLQKSAKRQKNIKWI